MPYLPHTAQDRADMLQALGIQNVDELFRAIPQGARLQCPLALPPGLAELELERRMSDVARTNRPVGDLVCFLGGGFYDRFIPAAVWALAGRGEFATAYTPYQPELSQGTLQAIYEFQSLIAELTAMDTAQASMYDGASAAAEAALMAMAHTGRRRVACQERVYPYVRSVVATYVQGRGGRVTGLDDVEPPAAVLIQYPDAWGGLDGAAEAVSAAHAQGALAIVYGDPVSWSVLRPPGRLGADVVVGEGQPLGNPLHYGGPTFGFFAVTAALMRRIPGRIVGRTEDREGRSGYVLTLQAREQHIRREKATSNICSNHSLNALAAAIYMELMGPQGVREVAELSAAKAHYLAEGLQRLGLHRPDPGAPFLYEFVVGVPGSIADLNAHLLRAGILGGWDLGAERADWQGLWQLAVTEKRTRHELDAFLEEVAQWMGSR